MPQFLLHGSGTFHDRNQVGPACWPHCDLFFVHRGSIRLEFDGIGESLQLRKGEGVLILPDTDFRGRAITQTARASVQHFATLASDGQPFDELRGRRGGFLRQQAATSLRALEQDVLRAQELAYQAGEPGLPETRTALLALILCEGGFLRSTLRIAGRIPLDEVRRWLGEAVAKGATLEAMAAHFSLSPSRLRDLFRQEHGLSAGEYVRTYREHEAKRLLAESGDPLKAVAERLGYADAVAFHRAFRNRTGMTPGQYRQHHRVCG